MGSRRTSSMRRMDVVGIVPVFFLGWGRGEKTKSVCGLSSGLWEYWSTAYCTRLWVAPTLQHYWYTAVYCSTAWTIDRKSYSTVYWCEVLLLSVLKMHHVIQLYCSTRSLLLCYKWYYWVLLLRDDHGAEDNDLLEGKRRTISSQSWNVNRVSIFLDSVESSCRAVGWKWGCGEVRPFCE